MQQLSEQRSKAAAAQSQLKLKLPLSPPNRSIRSCVQHQPAYWQLPTAALPVGAHSKQPGVLGSSRLLLLPLLFQESGTL
jgi:hypothetical protein